MKLAQGWASTGNGRGDTGNVVAMSRAAGDATMSGNVVRNIVLAWLLGTVPCTPALTAPFDGDPPVTRFVPRLDVYPQNFAFAQSPDGVVYIGNHDGVLAFNGEQWTETRLPNGDIVRSLAADAAGRIYVGGYNVFGYLERDVAGHEQFHDLTAGFSTLLDGETFADIWAIEVAPQGVFFRAVQHMFLFEPQSETVSLWRHEERFGDITQHRGEVILQFRGEGLRRFNGEGWEPLPGTESVRELVFDYVPLRDGSLLLLSNDGEWRRYDGTRVTAFDVPRGFPPSSDFTRGMLTRDGNVALSTADGALVILDPVKGSWRRLAVATGFISALAPARNGGIFMVSNEALVHVDWPARWTVTGKEHGLEGAVHRVVPWGSRWFVMTDAGVQELLDAPSDETVFARHDWTAHEAWDLLPVSDNVALLAESYVLAEVRDGVARAISAADFYPRIIERSQFAEDVVLVGTERGFAVVRRDGDSWRIALNVDDLDASAVSSIVQVSMRELWLGTERGGALHVRLAEGLDAVESVELAGSSDSGIEYGNVPGAFVSRTPDGRLLVSTARGVFTADGAHFSPDDLDGLGALRGDNEQLLFAVAPDGTHWAYSFNHVFSRAPGGDWRSLELGGQLRGAIDDITFDASGDALFGTTRSVLRHQALEATSGAAGNVALRSVDRVYADGTLVPQPLQTTEPLEFDADDVNLAFRFSLPEFLTARGAQYSARLDGLETQWSDWSGSSSFTYYRMRPGSYALQLRGRDSSGRITAIEPWRFRVIPHWYASPLALAAWTLAGLLLVGIAMQRVSRHRTGRLAAEKLRLQNMVAERTQELEDANHKLEAIAHLDGLTEIPNRRRLDIYLDYAWRQCMERERPLSLLVIDVDHFKRYNDRHGHIAGDRLLQQLARVLSRSLRRAEDLVARYGGEEFLIVLPGAELATARALAEQIRESVESSSLGATISVGLASAVPRTASSITELVGKADAALYAAKAANRNCVRASLPDGCIV